MQLIEHPLDPIWLLADVLEHQDAAVHRRKMRRAYQVRDHRQVAAPQRPARCEIRGTLQRQFDLVARACEERPAMMVRE
jgi:hypothetical protein